jgi:propionyl-CoA synthetase
VSQYTADHYDQIYARSLSNPEEFWGEAAEEITWLRRWDKVLDDASPPFYRWFQGGVLNTCYNAVDRHVEAGRGQQPAIIYDSPVTDTVDTITYGELSNQVAHFAGALRHLGVGRGDRVLIYMPMIPESVVAMLACARLGAVHSVVFGGFAAHELARRIDDCKPRVIVSASCGIEPNRIVEYKPMLDGAIEQSDYKPERCIILERPQERAALVPGRDLEWNDALAGVGAADCVPVSSTDPLYILYTSGATGRPKGIVRDNGGHAVALKWTMRNLYDVAPGEVYWSASDVGWVVGHSYIVYGPLLHGCTTIVFEGKPVGTPDAGVFWRTIQRHRVSTLFTAPTALRAIKRVDPQAEHVKKCDLSHFRALFMAGERSDPDTVRWAENHLAVPVIDHWWQTETGWAITCNPLGIQRLPVKHGSATRAMPGYDLRVLDVALQDVPPGVTGAIFAKLPLPPGSLSTLWGSDEGFEKSYLSTLPSYYETGDAGFIDEDGYVSILARTDDIINVAGHRLSTGGLEEVLASHCDVAECAVVGTVDQLKGQAPLGLIVLKTGVSRSHSEIIDQVIRMVRERIGPIADFKRAIVVDRLPKTRSGKILRAIIQKIADGQDYRIPPTIDDPDVLLEIAAALNAAGFPLVSHPPA